MDATDSRPALPPGFHAALDMRLNIILDRFHYAKAQRKEAYRTVRSTIRTMRSGVDALGTLGLRGQLFRRNEVGKFAAFGIVGQLAKGVGANARNVLETEKRFITEARDCEREYRLSMQSLARQFDLPLETVYAEVIVAQARRREKSVVDTLSNFLRGVGVDPTGAPTGHVRESAIGHDEADDGDDAS